MKKLILFVFFSLILFIQAEAQKKNVYFIKNNGNYVNQRDSADFIRVVQEPDSGTKLYIVKEFYTNGKRKSIGLSSKIDPPKYEGTYTSYYSGGHRKQILSYEKGRLVDNSYTYFPNGKLYTTLSYINQGNNHIQPMESGYLIKSVYDSTGKQLVVDGNGPCVFYDEDFHEITDKGLVKDGKKDSIWTGLDRKLGLTYTEHYVNGKLLSGESINENHETIHYLNPMSPPSYKGGITAFYKYLATSIRYPENCQRMGIQGQVVLKFVVEKDGSITNITVLNEVNPDLAQEAVRVLKQSTKWSPGTIKGKEVRVSYNIPVSFSLSRM